MSLTKYHVISLLLSVIVLTTLRVEAANISLHDILQIAVARHPQISGARSRITNIEAEVRQARAAQWPQINMDLRVERSTLNAATPERSKSYLDFGGIPVRIVEPEQDMSGYGRATAVMSAEYPLYDFGRRKWSVDSVEELAKRTNSDLDVIVNDVSFAVASSYYAVLKTDALVDVERKNHLRHDEALRAAKELRAAGRGAAGDVARAEAELARTELDLIQASGERDKALLNLLHNAGLPIDTRLPALDTRAAVPELPYLAAKSDELIKLAIDKRPELRSQGHVVASSMATIEKERAEHLPELALVGQYSVMKYTETDNVANYVVGMTLRWNLVDGGYRNSRLSAARSKSSVEKDRLDELRLKVVADVRSAVQRLHETKDLVSIAERMSAASEIDYRLVRKGYQEGVRTIYDLSNAQIGLKNAQAQQVIANYELQLARVRMYWALGVIDAAFGGN